MKYRYGLIVPFILITNSFAGEGELDDLSEVNTLEYALTQGTFKKFLRYSGQYRDSNLHVLQDSSTADISNEKTQQYTAIGGYLGYETAPFYNTSIGATLYTSQPFGNNPSDRKGLGGLYETDGGQDSYTVWGEAYIKFEQDKHLIKVGRQEMPDYRFVSLSNIRMTPLTHEGGVYENTVFDNLKFNLAYITKMKERNAEKFIDMAQSARLKEFSSGKQLVRGHYDPSDYDSSGYIGEKKEMSMAGLLYNNDAVSLEGWSYYINDFVNTLYLYGQYNFTPENSDVAVSLAAQYANQFDVGDHIAGNIDTWFYGLKLQAVTRGFTFFIGYNEVDYNENSYDGGSIFVRWGSPQMFNSFQVQDSELAGTKSYGAGVQYQFGHSSFIPGVVMRLRYADYNLPDNLSQTDARQDRAETTFDINYSFAKQSSLGNFSLDGLSVQFRLAYNDYNTGYDFDEYQRIHGYDFDNVTDDFVDARLYLDYKF
ncbi:MAG: OprD family porin [gamma proteobacterium symbiont of Taylorina sp.]|nr:OprD family porin [gamma proteobacterium symbiont of Taylorina sp.]